MPIGQLYNDVVAITAMGRIKIVVATHHFAKRERVSISDKLHIAG